jgi:hypothetical protein
LADGSRGGFDQNGLQIRRAEQREPLWLLHAVEVLDAIFKQQFPGSLLIGQILLWMRPRIVVGKVVIKINVVKAVTPRSEDTFVVHHARSRLSRCKPTGVVADYRGDSEPRRTPGLEVPQPLNIRLTPTSSRLDLPPVSPRQRPGPGGHPHPLKNQVNKSSPMSFVDRPRPRPPRAPMSAAAPRSPRPRYRHLPPRSAANASSGESTTSVAIGPASTPQNRATSVDAPGLGHVDHALPCSGREWTHPLTPTV